MIEPSTFCYLNFSKKILLLPTFFSSFFEVEFCGIRKRLLCLFHYGGRSTSGILSVILFFIHTSSFLTFHSVLPASLSFTSFHSSFIFPFQFFPPLWFLKWWSVECVSLKVFFSLDSSNVITVLFSPLFFLSHSFLFLPFLSFTFVSLSFFSFHVFMTF